MLKLVFTVLLLIFLTTVIVVINPQLHKEIIFLSVEFGVSDAKVETVAYTPQVEPVENTKTTSNTTIKTIENIPNKELIKINSVYRDTYMNNIKMRYQQEQAKSKQVAKVQSKPQIKKTVTPVKSTSTQKSTQKIVKQTVQKSVQPNKKVANKVVTQNKNTAVQKSQPIKPEAVKQEKQLVTQQETIAWNKWRADIANSIGTTTLATLKEKVEVGTTIKYSFNVDKNEQISNVVVSVIKGPTSTSAQSAKSVIYKAIKSLNGKSILVFPKGTNRTSTTVVGAIELSDKTVKTDKSMFNDYEIITKQYYK